jgi:uncharacterized RDD family membrane protein YckC
MSTPPDHPTAPALQAASWLRRIGALVIDWVASSLVVAAIVGPARYSGREGSWLPLLVFWLEASLGTALAGASFGQLVTRIRVLRTDGRQLSLLRALGRTAMVCLVVPPLVFRPDGRGLHDLATGSAAYELPR